MNVLTIVLITASPNATQDMMNEEPRERSPPYNGPSTVHLQYLLTLEWTPNTAPNEGFVRVDLVILSVIV